MVLSVSQQTFLCSVVLACGVVVGCGGGGSGSSATSAAATNPVATPAVVLGTSVMTGVVSTGAPVMGGQLRMIDATGAEVRLLDAAGIIYPPGQSIAQTSSADGSYRVSLANSNQTLPLFVQVSGVDASGLPVLLHSVLSSSSLPLIANVSPLTDAVLAQIFGANPRDVWTAAATNANAIKPLGTASMLTASADLIKTVIKANLTDGKISDGKTLDLFRDSSFLANKTGLDLALEGLRIQIVKTPAGLDQLQLSNKFVSYAAPEVKIDLITAQAELNKATGGVVANAIVSTLKATTSPTTVLVNLGSLDNLSAQLNALIAQSSPVSTATTFNESKLLPSTGTYPYVMHNGRTKSQLANLLATFTASNWQLGRLLVTGCADDPIPTKGCLRLAVSTLVTDTQGLARGVFSDVVSYQGIPAVAAVPAVIGVTAVEAVAAVAAVPGVPASGVTPAVPPKAAVPAVAAVAGVTAVPAQAAIAALPAQWRLVGNGAQTQFEIFPATYAQYGSTGELTPPTSSQPNPSSSVVINFRAKDWSTTPVSNLVEALVKVPSNFSTRFSNCEQTYLCINPTPSGTAATYSGMLQDTLVMQPYPGWVGSADTVAGVKYAASFTLGTTTTPTYSQNAYLNADVPVTPSPAFLPVLNTLPTMAAIQAGGKLRWSNWAAANPHMKMKSVRLIVNNVPPVAIEYPLPVTGAIELDLSTSAAPASATSYHLLLTSQDNLGRFFYSAVMVDK